MGIKNYLGWLFSGSTWTCSPGSTWEFIRNAHSRAYTRNPGGWALESGSWQAHQVVFKACEGLSTANQQGSSGEINILIFHF